MACQEGDSRFSVGPVAGERRSSNGFPPREKVVQPINGIGRDSDAALLLWRVVQQARENPVGKVQAAMAGPVLEPADSGAVVLPEMAG
jgi:hypothetical protein